MINLDKLISSSAGQDNVNGSWYAIQWSPEPRSGERFNLGVAISHSGGTVDFKLIDQFNRFECVYGKSSEAIFHAQLAVEVIESLLSQADEVDLQLINQNVQFNIDKRGVVRGEDVFVLIDQLFDEMVPMGRPEEKSIRMPSVSRAKAVSEVKKMLRERKVKLKGFMPSNSYVAPEGSRKIYLPVRSEHSTATIASAKVSGEHTAKLNIYEAQEDIRLSKSYINKKHNYLHILLPEDGLESRQMTSIENQIDSVSFFLKKEEIKLVTHNDEYELSEYLENEFLATG